MRKHFYMQETKWSKFSIALMVVLLNYINASVTKTICKMHCRNDNIIISYQFSYDYKFYCFRRISIFNLYLLWYQNF